MPTPLVISNSAMVRLIWDLNGKQAINVLGAQWIATPNNSQALADALSTALRTRFTSSGLAAQMHTTTRFSGAAIRDISSPNQPEFVGAGTGPLGTGTGDPMPRSVAMCITLRTASAGRSYRGRVYLGGFTEAVNTSIGTILQAAVDAAVAFVQGVQTDMTANNLRFAVLSRPRAQVVIPEKIIAGKSGWSTPVTLVQSRNVFWETQRNRTV